MNKSHWKRAYASYRVDRSMSKCRSCNTPQLLRYFKKNSLQNIEMITHHAIDGGYLGIKSRNVLGAAKKIFDFEGFTIQWHGGMNSSRFCKESLTKHFYAHVVLFFETQSAVCGPSLVVCGHRILK